MRENMRFLIVEDELHLNNILYDYIDDFFIDSVIDQAFDGSKALELFNENTYDIVLLDVMLPLVDGFDICKEIKNTSDTPVIMLSALSDEENQIRGYELGIDEFVKKPYSPKLVIKKVQAVLQRTNLNVDANLKNYGIIRYDLVKQKVYIDNVEIRLNKKEWELFNLFIHNKGIVLTRDTILNKIWGYEYFGDIRTVDTHIKRLRQKLFSAGLYIRTIHKTGYKFEK
jgi:two-component system response regulator VanR